MIVFGVAVHCDVVRSDKLQRIIHRTVFRLTDGSEIWSFASYDVPPALREWWAISFITREYKGMPRAYAKALSRSYPQPEE